MSLKEGKELVSWKIYLILINKEKVLKKYIKENLKKEYI